MKKLNKHGQAIDLSRLSIDPEHFWSFVDIAKPNECWHWIRGKGTRGYGSYSVKSDDEFYERTGRSRRTLRASRIAYMLSYGSLDNDMMVCHHCDNPSCCNPKHLFKGRGVDNMADRRRKGRY